METMKEGITFSDVLLVPKRSTIASRKSVDTSGSFSRNIKLKCPIVSANMDTVTEADMAIAMAQAGGLGIIHRFLTIEEEAAQVAKVKRTESVLIEEPYTISPRDTVGAARDFMRSKQVGGLLVVGEGRKLLGVVSERDLQFHDDDSAPVKAVMSSKLVTARPGITLEAAAKVLARHKIEKLPIIDASGTLKGLITAKDIKKKRLHPEASEDPKGRLLVGAAVGVVGDFMERSAALLSAGADVLVVDVAHGHSDHVIEAVARIKKRWPAAELVAGNVATYEGARDLTEAGADGIKVGVGPGSICSTRIVSGAGVPQLTAILDCAKLTAKSGVPVISDGGVRDPGDITKAMAAGASSVMIGSLLAGTEESPGLMIVRGGIKYKLYRGMASLTATLSRRITESGGHHRVDDEEAMEVVAEGVESMVPFRGRAFEVVHQLAGGLRSGMSYSGARTVAELWRKAEFIRITPAAWAESLPRLERKS
ncbi:MAG: IMP dehydrogenase [Elusimicrobia bacterium]|nr:IMP dehydrogenase [Elusimicrobiota bacterium]